MSENAVVELRSSDWSGAAVKSFVFMVLFNLILTIGGWFFLRHTWGILWVIFFPLPMMFALLWCTIFSPVFGISAKYIKNFSVQKKSLIISSMISPFLIIGGHIVIFCLLSLLFVHSKKYFFEPFVDFWNTSNGSNMYLPFWFVNICVFVAMYTWFMVRRVKKL